MDDYTAAVRFPLQNPGFWLAVASLLAGCAVGPTGPGTSEEHRGREGEARTRPARDGRPSAHPPATLVGCSTVTGLQAEESWRKTPVNICVHANEYSGDELVPSFAVMTRRVRDERHFILKHQG